MSEEEDKKKEDDDHFYHRQLEDQEQVKTKKYGDYIRKHNLKLSYEDHWDAFWNNDKSK